MGVFGPTRGHPLMILEGFFKNFGLLIGYGGLALITGGDLLENSIEFLLLCLIGPIRKVVSYFSTYIFVDEEKIVITSGIITKKKVEIPMQTITAIDYTQSLIFQLAGVYKVSMDNGSQSGEGENKAEVHLVLGESKVRALKEMLGSKVMKKGKREEHITASVKEVILMGLLQSHILQLFSFFTLIGIGGNLVENSEGIQGAATAVFGWYTNTFSVLYGILILGIVAYSLAVVWACGKSYIQYYEYRITARQDAILLQYGLFTKKKYTLNKEKISGIVLRQTLLMRIFGYVTLEVLMIGFGDSSAEGKKEQATLYPIMRKQEVIGFLEKLLPNYSYGQRIEYSQRESFRYFFLCFRFMFATIVLVGSLVGQYGLTSTGMGIVRTGLGILWLIAIASVILEYKNTGIGSSKEMMYFSIGGISKTAYYIFIDKLEYATYRSNRWKDKKKFGSIRIGVHAPAPANAVNVRNVRKERFEELSHLLE